MNQLANNNKSLVPINKAKINPIPDEKPMLEWVDKDKLEIDHVHYQRTRKEEEPLIRSMTKDWSWAKCGALNVSMRDGTRLFISDGQARWMAASQRDDIKELPCAIYAADS